MNENGVRRMLDKACKKAGGIRALAADLGVSYQAVWVVLNGKREPTDTILAALGLERVVTYRVRREEVGR